MTKFKPLHFRLLFFSLVVLALVGLARLNRPQAASLTNVSVTMSNSRLSYRGQVDGTPGSDPTIDLIIDPAISDYTVNSNTEVTDVLKVTDSLTFTTSGSRTIQDIIDEDTITISSAIATTDETFYLSEVSSLTAVFTTNTVVTEGYFQVLVPAATSSNADGIPDQGFFDFGGSSPTVTCDTTGSHTIGVTSAQSNQSGSSLPSGTWNVYTCNYTTGGAGTITIGIPTIINPAPASDHFTGVADTYSVIVRNLSSSDVVIDSTIVKIGTIEAVRVSATVEPFITFTIKGDDGTTTRCGQVGDDIVATTASEVPFGIITTNSFLHGVQELEVTTNALNGAVVTTIANDQLGRDGGACVGKLEPTYAIGSGGVDEYKCIWDANVASMSHTNEVDWTWTTYEETGFGYSIENINATPAFEYDDGAGDFVAKHFPDAELTATPTHEPEDIFSNNSPTNSTSIYVCYRIRPDSLTAAGDYYNYITYTATATF